MAASRPLFFLLAAAIGMVVGLATIGLIEAISLVQYISFGRGSETEFASIAGSAEPWRVVVAPVVGGIIVGLVLYLLPGGRYHGISDVMEACAVNGGRMGVRSGIGAAFATSVSLGVGAPLGREGPAVHIGASLSAWMAERLGLDRSQTLALLGCGAAAAVTTSFNAPIAGVIFALEVIVGYYTLRVFAPVVVASLASVVVRNTIYGTEPLFSLPQFSLGSYWELLLFALLGVTGALLVILFIRLVIACRSAWEKTRIPLVARPAIAGLAVGLLALEYPLILSVGYEPVNMALHESLVVSDLGWLLILKVLATVVALASGFAGGVFSPSVFLGAMLGGVFWFLCTLISPETLSGQGVYSIVGMAGVASAMLGAPISTVLIVFEITRSYDITIAVMIAAAIASTVMQTSRHSSFFRWQLASRNVNISAGRDMSLLMTHTVENLVNDQFVTASLNDTVRQAEKKLVAAGYRVVMVIDEAGQLTGCIDLRELVSRAIDGGFNQPIRQYMRPADFAVRPSTNVVNALKIMGSQGVPYLPVIADVSDDEAANEHHVIGVVFKTDLLAEHYEVLRSAREEEFGIT